MKLYIVRHGETNFNQLGLCNSPSDDVFLTEKGISQSIETGENLRDLKVDFDLIITSGAPRVTHTLKNIFEGTLPLHEVDSRIGEMRSGFDGKPVKEYIEFISHDPVNAKAKGGESFFDVYSRVGDFLKDLAQRTEESVLIVTHRNVIRAIKMNIESIPLMQVESVPIPGNCEIYITTI